MNYFIFLIKNLQLDEKTDYIVKKDLVDDERN